MASKTSPGCERSQKSDARKKKNRWRPSVPRFRCMKLDESEVSSSAERSNGRSSGLEITPIGEGVQRRLPNHLVIMVNGLLGSSTDWKFATKQFSKKHPFDLVIHRSKRNISGLTFDGVDVMGERLSEEVIEVIRRYSSLEKISFIGHSLGGIIARYAIARLYRPVHGDNKAKIAGLDPVNFITVATPHLGSRGHNQVPAFCGLYNLEIVASRASGVLGKTGRHLFLADKKNGKPPLLLRMTNDCEELPFISALRSFRRRVAYANARFDHLVGWSSSSLRRSDQLPNLRSLHGPEAYPHVINVDPDPKPVPDTRYPNHKTRRPWTTQIEDEMITNLTQMNWERVDVDFRDTWQRLHAHITIQSGRICCDREILQFPIVAVILIVLSTGICFAVGVFRSPSAGGEVFQDFQREDEAVGVVSTAAWRRTLIGSRPPVCSRRCSGCPHCDAIQVPIVPQRHHFRSRLIRQLRGDDISNYKPLTWKCKCGNLIYNP